jgi:RNA polymerase sigma factor (sigma-70 family)
MCDLPHIPRLAYTSCGMPDSLDDWFIREILAHEAALTRYLTRVWPRASDIPDIRHDTYIKVLEAAAHTRPHSPKSFLFSIARHLLADRARRTRIVAIDLMEDLDPLNVLVDELSPEHRASVRQQLVSVAAAFNQLPPKCREVVWMKRVQNLSHKEIAALLGITVGTVEKHIVKGIRLLTDILQGGDVDLGRADEKRSSGRGTRHEN